MNRSEAEKLFKDIDGFLKKELTGTTINTTATQDNWGSAPCWYILPFSFKCPEGTNTCISNLRKNELINASLKCDFLGNQSKCKYYQPDPDYQLRLQLHQKIEQMETAIEQFIAQYKETGEREILGKAIKVTKKLIKLSENDRLFTDLFGGLKYFPTLVYQVQLKDLEEELRRQKKLSPWYSRIFF